MSAEPTPDMFFARMLVEKARRRPSDAQVKTFGEMIDAWGARDAKLTAEMDEEDGTMLVILEEDGATQMSRFGRNGKILGPWF